MKKLLLVFITSLILNNIIGQQFYTPNLTVGTIWTYEYKNYITNTTSFVEYIITDSLMWQGKSAFQINDQHGIYGYLHIDNDKYYFWNNDLNEYQLNYDFGELESYKVPYSAADGTVKYATIKIDSLGKELVDGVWLDAQYVSTNFGLESDPPRDFIFYKNIGYSKIGPKLNVGTIIDFIFDSIGDIRCFQDDSMNINFVEYPCDSVWQILSVNSLEDKKINLYPNPASQILNIDLFNNNKYDKIKIVDLKGKIIYSGETKSKLEISVENFTSGIYFVQLIDQKGATIQMKKFTIIN